MSGHFVAKYSDTQKAAVIAEKERDPKATYGEISRRLAAGDIFLDGEPVEPIEMDPYYIGQLVRDHRRKVRGEVDSGLSKMTHGDAMEAVRKRLLALTEYQLAREERKMRNKGGSAAKDIDPTKIQQLARAAREIAHLDPDPVRGRKPAPGARKGSEPSGGTNGTTPTTGLAGEIMRDHQASAASAHGEGA